MLDGDVDTGKALPREYIKATVGFAKLGADIGSSGKTSSACLAPRAIRKRGIFSLCWNSCRSMQG